MSKTKKTEGEETVYEVRENDLSHQKRVNSQISNLRLLCYISAIKHRFFPLDSPSQTLFPSFPLRCIFSVAPLFFSVFSTPNAPSISSLWLFMPQNTQVPQLKTMASIYDVRFCTRPRPAIPEALQATLANPSERCSKK